MPYFKNLSTLPIYPSFNALTKKESQNTHYLEYLYKDKIHKHSHLIENSNATKYHPISLPFFLIATDSKASVGNLKGLF